MGDETGCANIHGLSLLSTSYRILSNILLSRLGPYVDEITGYHQHKRSTTDQAFCIRQVLNKGNAMSQ
jgi:hypothetical protein